MNSNNESDMVEITPDNMHKYAAMLRFQMEAELGHALPDGVVYATIKDGQAMIIVKDGK
jgi:hypothetical protein